MNFTFVDRVVVDYLRFLLPLRCTFLWFAILGLFDEEDSNDGEDNEDFWQR